MENGILVTQSVKEFQHSHEFRGHTRKNHGPFLRAKSKVRKWLIVLIVLANASSHLKIGSQ